MTTAKELCEKILQAKRQEKALAQKRRHYEAALVMLILDKDYGTDSKTFVQDGYKIRITAPKRVTWDQDTLAIIAQNMEAAGDTITNYAKTKYEISESHFSAWPDYIKKAFSPARTVAVGATQVTIEEESSDV